MRYNERAIWDSPRDGRIAAGQKLQAAVSALTRARRLQVFAEFIWAGLFWGIVAACAAVLIIRLSRVFAQNTYALSIPMLVLSLIAAALIVAAIAAWRRLPDDMQVVILADVQLNLKQKLSTAWEFARTGGDSVMSERLAVQAVQARLPARPERVFPLPLNIWGRLTPVVAILLLLLVILDFQPAARPKLAGADASVVSQGRQLREYGQRMEAQSQREALPRSTRKAQDLQRLGSRMESGALSRQQALRRLRQLGTVLDEQRRAALSEGLQIKLDPRQIEAVKIPSAARRSDLQTMLAELAQGLLDGSDVKLSASDQKMLSQLGISRQDLEEALQRLAEGDGQGVRRITETLSRAGQALRESETLAAAQRKITRVRENLGDNDMTSGYGDGAAEKPRAGAGEGDAAGARDGPPGDAFGDKAEAFIPGPGAGYNRQGNNNQSAPFERPDGSDGIVLKPESQLRQGAVYTSEVRVMPRFEQPVLETVDLDAEFSAQLEAVLSKEQYPLHQKEFIRRYFLTLSDGVLSETAVDTEE